MYEEPKKLNKSKRIELVLLIATILWGLLFIVNYVRYTHSKPLFLAMHIKDDSYDDGFVEEYISFGYVYRSYQRNSIAREEFVPFWVTRENPESENALPKPITGYEVPNNPRKSDKLRGLLYYYSIKGELLGTYKCINSTMDCEKAVDGKDVYDLKNKDPLTRVENPHMMNIIHDKFAFVDDSLVQDDQTSSNKIIYLYQFTPNEEQIIARFSDVKESTYDDYYEKADGERHNYIVRSYENNKWGVIKINESGSIEEIMPFEYDSISFDEDTKFYILCKDNKWSIYDLDKDTYQVEGIETPIYDVWRNDNLTYYYKIGKDRTVGKDSFIDYKVYRLDGKIFVDGDRITEIVARDRCIFYVTSTDNVLHFIDYSGSERYKIQLAFSELEHDFTSNPAFEIVSEKNDYILLRIYKGRDKSYDFDTTSVNIVHWEYNS